MSFINWLTGKKTLRTGNIPNWVKKSKLKKSNSTRYNSLRPSLSQKRNNFIKKQQIINNMNSEKIGKKKRNQYLRDTALKVRTGSSIPQTQNNRQIKRNSRRNQGMNNMRSLNAPKIKKKAKRNTNSLGKKMLKKKAKRIIQEYKKAKKNSVLDFN